MWVSREPSVSSGLSWELEYIEGITAMVFALETPEPEARLNGVLRACTVSVEHKIPKCCGLPAHERL
jgi:hypothetical protein